MLAFLAAVVLSCSSDADCVLMTRCTCDCCPSPEAMTKQQAGAERLRCAKVGPCDRRTGCNDMACPEEKASVAVCKAGRCAKVPKPPK